jgi:hypothetical protein
LKYAYIKTKKAEPEQTLPDLTNTYEAIQGGRDLASATGSFTHRPEDGEQEDEDRNAVHSDLEGQDDEHGKDDDDERNRRDDKEQIGPILT